MSYGLLYCVYIFMQFVLMFQKHLILKKYNVKSYDEICITRNVFIEYLADLWYRFNHYGYSC